MADKTLADGVEAKPKARKGSPHVQEVDDDPKKSVAGKNDHWGYELIIDISGCSKNVNDEKAVRAFFKDMVAALKMETLGEPVFRKPPKGKGRGITAVQFIMSSSILLHSDEQGESAFLNVFSCESFLPKTGIAVIKRHFKPKHVGKPKWLHRDAGPWPEK